MRKMNGMNIETAAWRGEPVQGEAAEHERTILIVRRRRRALIVGAAALLIAVIAMVLFYRQGHDAAPVRAAPAVPSVTVVVPGRQQVAKLISGTGSLAARHDMPVG